MPAKLMKFNVMLGTPCWKCRVNLHLQQNSGTTYEKQEIQEMWEQLLVYQDMVCSVIFSGDDYDKKIK